MMFSEQKVVSQGTEVSSVPQIFEKSSAKTVTVFKLFVYISKRLFS